MCGIYGQLFKDGEIHKDQFYSNLQMLQHRGPDAEGLWFSPDNRSALSFKRLSILDLSEAGNQPMIDDSGQYVIVFNGEIYNHLSLREELKELGHDFHSTTDTEVLLKSFIEWPDAFLSKIEGMYSFAIYDQHMATITLARDFAGQKPLYYYFSDTEFRFASELKPIINNHMSLEINKNSLNNLFKFGFTHQSSSLLKNFNKLGPGERLIIDLNAWKKSIFKDPKLFHKNYQSNFRNSKDLKNLSHKLIDLLNESIESQLYADVEVGVMLSGGLDSSIITALASKLKSSLKTFSATFPENIEADESIYSNKIAKYFNTDHHELSIKDISPSFLEDIIYFYDDPISSPSFIPTYLICREIKKHCKVVLGGDGADELFGGYHQYSRIKTLNLSSNRFFNNFYVEPRFLINFIENSNLKGKGLLLNIFSNLKVMNHSLVSWFSDHERKKLFGFFENENFQNELDLDNHDHLNRLLKSDFQYYLPEEILKKVDRSSMANSLEVRAPYLDSKIIMFAFNEIPSKFKVSSRERKIILQKVGSSILPKDFEFNRKQGFSFPINSYFSLDDWQEFFLLKLSNTDADIDKDFARSYLQKHKKKKNQGLKLFTILIFLIWHEKFISKDKISIN